MRIADYFWHIALPITALVIGGFATLTMLTKNCFLDEINKQYVLTARAKGLSEHRVLYGHIFRNAMLLVVASFPAAFVGILFTGSLLIEVIFSLDGLGLLGFEAAINRDYPIMFGTLYVFTLIGLLLKLISDLTYMFIDPRIDFGTPHPDRFKPAQPPIRRRRERHRRVLITNGFSATTDTEIISATGKRCATVKDERTAFPGRCIPHISQ
jgi:ABC-type microcin C transport system permease subunit YejB